MKKAVYPNTLGKPTMYERMIKVHCWLKIIPLVDRDKNNTHVQFRLLSMPTLLSSLWCWIPLSYFLFVRINVPTMPEDSNYDNVSLENTNKTVSGPTKITLDYIIFTAFQVINFLLILLLPPSLGHFFACNELALKGRFAWSPRAWIVVLSAAIFLATEVTTSFIFASQSKASGLSTWDVIQYAAAEQLVNVTACLLQLSALILVSSRQTHFIKSAAKNRKFITCYFVNDYFKILNI
jgi:hypothetical protein